MLDLPSSRTVLPITGLIAILYAYAEGAGELQPLFLIPTTILAGAAASYLWKTVVQTSLVSYAAHAGALGFVWAFYLIYREDFIERLSPVSAKVAPIVLYVCLAFSVLVLIRRLCRQVRPTLKWAAVLLALYPVFLIIITLAVKDTTNQKTPGFHFGAVVEKINVKGISLPYQIYRYHASKRTVALPELELKSICLSVNNTQSTEIERTDLVEISMTVSAVLEVIDKDGRTQHVVPPTVQFDGIPLESGRSNHRLTEKIANSIGDATEPDRNLVDGQLIIISNDSQPYDWDVFYLLPSASHTLGNRRADNQRSTN